MEYPLKVALIHDIHVHVYFVDYEDRELFCQYSVAVV